MRTFHRDRLTRCPAEEPAAPLGEVLARLRRGPLFREAEVRSHLEEEVAGALGAEFAERVRVGPVRQGRLVLFVDDPAYRFELQNYRYSALLAAVQQGAPGAGIGELQFRLSRPFRHGGRSQG